MSVVKYLAMVLIVVATGVVVTGRPQQHTALELDKAANMSVCPIKVVINDDHNRVPRRIKFIQCAETPNRLCTKHNMTHGCCNDHAEQNYVTECVEVNDWVQVSYKNNPTPTPILVPVGCSCVIQETTTASEIPNDR